MDLIEYYFHDPRLILIPIEQLTPRGIRREFAPAFAARAGWEQVRIDLFNHAFALYWERTTFLASRTHTWAPPRVRHVAIVTQPLAVRPYVQLLNTSSWMLYEGDFDPTCSHAEFAAYLLVHGDRMALTGEVTAAALQNAAYWFERTEAERGAFAAAAARSTRPDAAALRALADATPWLSRLYHDVLRPPPGGTACRAIPGTGLLVPRAHDAHPVTLVRRCTVAARDAVAAYHTHWRTADRGAVEALCEWLAGDVPPLLVTGPRGRMLWEPAMPTHTGALRGILRAASGAAVRDILADLQVVAERTRAVHAALTEPSALPRPLATTDQSGYTFLHRDRGLIAYNLDEPGMERLQGPALPYARAMLGARTIHEWAHLAVDAGWVPQTAPATHVAALTQALAEQLDAALAAASGAVRERTARDVLPVPEPRATRGSPTTAALVRILLRRLPDYQANLLACRFWSAVERETYVRHNIRALRSEYPPEQLWRMLMRYLCEYQYLAFSSVADRRAYFLQSTWFDADFFATGALDAARFDLLAATVQALCATYSVDETRFRAPR
jgi:hypothetical protein